MTDKKELQEIIVDWMRLVDTDDDPEYEYFMNCVTTELGQTMLESGNYAIDVFDEYEITTIICNTIEKELKGQKRV